MKKSFLTLCITIMFCSNFYAQEVLIEQNVLNDTVKDNFGPNLENFLHFFVGYGFVVGQPSRDGANIIPGKSRTYEIGSRYKYKVSNFYAIGSSFSFISYAYAIKQDDNKVFPDARIHRSEYITSYCLSYGVYNRFNFGKRGNHIGKFVDVGVNGDWCFSNRHLYRDDLGSGIVAKTVVKGQRYFEPFTYGIYANVGFNRLVLTCRYRISDIFKPKYNFPQMPPINIGLQIGLH